MLKERSADETSRKILKHVKGKAAAWVWTDELCPLGAGADAVPGPGSGPAADGAPLGPPGAQPGAVRGGRGGQRRLHVLSEDASAFLLGGAEWKSAAQAELCAVKMLQTDSTSNPTSFLTENKQ